eukprot:275085-Chlamydomonas_euryale.AAC.2
MADRPLSSCSPAGTTVQSERGRRRDGGPPPLPPLPSWCSWARATVQSEGGQHGDGRPPP